VSASPTQLVQDAVSSHKVAVFSKSYCPFCAKAKQTLGSMLQPSDMFVMELDQRADGDAIQQVLAGITGSSSVPKVFIGGQFIGGGDDTVAKAANGELAQLLKAQGLAAMAS
jgi:glutaredoxin 3